MRNSKNKFTFKIILSYLVLGALSVLVAVFVYSEFKNYTEGISEKTGEKKFIETGTLINLVYETDGFSRLALLTENDAEYEQFIANTDSLFKKIEEIKLLSTNNFQLKQLDSVKALLEEKTRNIEQLRILRLTNKKDTSLDDILKEVKKLEASIGLNSVETLVKNPNQLSKRDRRIWQNYAEYLNNSIRDTSRIKSKTVDSMLTASRYIVAEAKKENSRIRESLIQKENELIRNDLNISARLREIIASFDREIARNNTIEKTQRDLSIERTTTILRFAAIIGAIAVLLFSYFILSDFFKAEKFKNNLEESKNYAESLLKSREMLISTVSHDLKTPLNTITGYSELFENSSLTEKQKYYLQQITSSSHFISHLVDDLLDFSKLEAGKLPLETVPFSLENIIVQAGNASKQIYLQKNVDLKISIAEKIKSQIFESDPLRIRQIINNLVGNAFKFTEEGTVEIRVTQFSEINNKTNIKIEVIDTGIGISKEKQELIFQEFTQAEVDTAHKFGGSGLGLAISKKLTELLGGSLEVTSVLGEGSTFTLILPLKVSQRIQHSRQPEKQEDSHVFEGLKAVIIDDDDAMRALLQEIFEQFKITSQAFSTFEKFQFSGGEFNFLLTDIQMPGTDGFAVLQKLKNGEAKNYNNQPIIAMTGSREHNRNYYLDKGFAEMLPKPFSKNELLSVLTEVLNIESSLTVNAEDEEINSEVSEKYDLSLLKSFLDSDKALNEILEVFYQQTEKDLHQLHEAISDKHFSKIEEISHRMLTMFRQIKAHFVVPILEKMENYSHNETEAQLLKDYKKLTTEITVLENSLKNR
ncbi:hybrid sensor histidine kinase/response regulator [Aequorivita echinoideorum]|uniref:histidine kinase n=1 Tax=Aequorivita echinoideorum TaxID=1549647 RepID=A0ABS5S1N4_9FLAO|nr:ATP-binding protein [Aequorivita echinoideorum]MBT0606888.1 response regulator [Aequorivita echinoideorum]